MNFSIKRLFPPLSPRSRFRPRRDAEAHDGIGLQRTMIGYRPAAHDAA